MDRVELLERKEKKGDILLKMVAISGEMPANLPEKIVGSKSYTASLITASFTVSRWGAWICSREERKRTSFGVLSSGYGKLSYRSKRNESCEIRIGKTITVASHESNMDLLFYPWESDFSNRET